jgi:hypothetical protein
MKSGLAKSASLDTSVAPAASAQDALEMLEQHLDFLPFTPRSHVSNSPGDFTRNVSSLFVDRTQDLAGRHLRTTDAQTTDRPSVIPRPITLS